MHQYTGMHEWVKIFILDSSRVALGVFDPLLGNEFMYSGMYV